MNPYWTGWSCYGNGRSSTGAAHDAAFQAIMHIIQDIPVQLEEVLPGVFPSCDTDLEQWVHKEGNPLEAGEKEAQYSTTAAASMMFAVMKGYHHQETFAAYRQMLFEDAKREAKQQKRQFQAQIQQLNEELARVKDERDAAVRDGQTAVQQARNEARSEIAELKARLSRFSEKLGHMEDANFHMRDELLRWKNGLGGATSQERAVSDGASGRTPDDEEMFEGYSDDDADSA